MQLKENWSHSTVTWHGGTSYSIGGVRFVKGAPKRVTSKAVRRAIEGVDGFLIQDFHEPEPNAAPKKVVVKDPPEGETDPAEVPAPKKKTVKKKKKVKKVKGGTDA